MIHRSAASLVSPCGACISVRYIKMVLLPFSYPCLFPLSYLIHSPAPSSPPRRPPNNLHPQFSLIKLQTEDSLDETNGRRARARPPPGRGRCTRKRAPRGSGGAAAQHGQFDMRLQDEVLRQSGTPCSPPSRRD
jgi:hypothetical protein